MTKKKKKKREKKGKGRRKTGRRRGKRKKIAKEMRCIEVTRNVSIQEKKIRKRRGNETVYVCMCTCAQK